VVTGTPEAFSHLLADPSVMELPAVFLSQVDWVYSSQSGFALVPPAVLGTAWVSLHCITVVLQGCSSSSLTSVCCGCVWYLLPLYLAGN